MPRFRPFAESAYTLNLVWKPEGRVAAISNLGHKIVFILGEQHRDEWLKTMRGRHTKQVGETKLTSREKRALQDLQ
jgi:hypothetical protein